MPSRNRRRYHEPSPKLPKNLFCRWCNKAYARQGALDNHIKTQHPRVRSRTFRKIASGGIGKPGSSSSADVVDLRSPSPDGDRPHTTAGPRWQTVNCESSAIRGPTIHQHGVSNVRRKVSTRTTAQILSSDDEDAPEGSRGLRPRVSPIRPPSPVVLSDSSDDERGDVKPFLHRQQGMVESEYGDSDNDGDDEVGGDDVVGANDHWEAPDLPPVDHDVDSGGDYGYDSKHESDDKGDSESDEETTTNTDSDTSSTSSHHTPRRVTIPRVGTLPPLPLDTNGKGKKLKGVFVPGFGFGAMGKGVKSYRHTQASMPGRKGEGVDRVHDSGASPKKIVEEEPSGIAIGLHNIQLKSPMIDKGKGKAVDRSHFATATKEVTEPRTLDKGKGVDRAPLVSAVEEALRSRNANKGKGVIRPAPPSHVKSTALGIVDRGKVAEKANTSNTTVAANPAETLAKNNAPTNNQQQLPNGTPKGVKRPAPETTSTPQKKRAPSHSSVHQVRIPPTPSTSGESSALKGNFGSFLEHCKEAEDAEVLRQQTGQSKADMTCARAQGSHQGKTELTDTDKPTESNASDTAAPVANTPQCAPLPIRVPSDSGQSQYQTPPSGTSPTNAHYSHTDTTKQPSTPAHGVNVQPSTNINQVFPPTPGSIHGHPHGNMNHQPIDHPADGCAECDSLSAAATVFVQSFVRMAHGIGHTGRR